MPSKHAATLPRRNGRFPVVLMAGAPADRARELRDRLGATRGILVRYHLDYERQVRIDRVPEDVDFVLLIKSQFGHAAERAVRDAIEKSERERGEPIPLVRTQHKMARIDGIMRFRFSDYGKGSLPLEVLSTAYFAKLHEAPAAEPEPPKYVRTLAPPELTPVPVPRLSSLLADANDAAGASKWNGYDTATLIREIQGRMVALGATSLLVTATSIEFGTHPPAARALPEVPAHPGLNGSANGTNGKANGAALPATSGTNGAAH